MEVGGRQRVRVRCTTRSRTRGSQEAPEHDARDVGLNARGCSCLEGGDVCEGDRVLSPYLALFLQCGARE